LPGPPSDAFAPILLLLIVLATDVWVYLDAKALSNRGTSVYVALGSLRVDTPAAWFVGCVLLWIVFFPLYLSARGR
jgi:hypothetical protein